MVATEGAGCGATVTLGNERWQLPPTAAFLACPNCAFLPPAASSDAATVGVLLLLRVRLQQQLLQQLEHVLHAGAQPERVRWGRARAGQRFVRPALPSGVLPPICWAVKLQPAICWQQQCILTRRLIRSSWPTPPAVRSPTSCPTPAPSLPRSNLCYYSWAAAGVGLFFALWLFFMQVCTGRSRHIPVCEVMVCILALCWWIAAATTGASRLGGRGLLPTVQVGAAIGASAACCSFGIAGINT